MLARAYLAIDRFLMRALRGVEALHRGVWLGAMRVAALHETTARFYRGNPLYFDSAHNDAGLFSWEKEALGSWFANVDSIVIAGCGGGREVHALARSGYQITGFDPDQAFVAHAAQSDWPGCLHKPRLLVSEMDGIPQDIGRHDAAIIGWGAYTHIVGRATRVNFLTQLAERLPDDAPLLLSFWGRVAGDKQVALMHGAASLTAALTCNPRKPELGDGLRRFFVHMFDEADIRQELASAGFELLRFSYEPYPHAVAVLKRGSTHPVGIECSMP